MSSRLSRAARWAAWLAPVAACAQVPTPLTLEQALARAVERSAAVQAAQAGVAGARESAQAAGRLPDPMLRVGVENLPATGSERWRPGIEGMTMKRVALSQEWPGAARLAAQRAVAQARTDSEQANRAVAEAEVRWQTALAYVDAWFAGETVALAERHVVHARLDAEVARARLRAGDPADEAQAAESALGMAEDELAEARQQQGLAQVALQRWIGEGVSALAAPRLPAPPEVAAFVARHPLRLQRERGLAVARQEAAQARADRRPGWTWEVAYGQRNGLSDLVSVGVTVPLPVAPSQRQDREVAMRQARVQQADQERLDAERAAQAEHAAASLEAERLAQRLQRWREAVVVPAERRTEVALAAYRSAQAPWTAVAAARDAALGAQRRGLALQREHAKALALLAFKPILEGAGQ